MLSRWLPIALGASALVVHFAYAVAVPGRRMDTACKFIPGDSHWPKQETWDSLNETVQGRLIATVPQAAVCHVAGYGGLQYNDTACKALQPVWDDPKTFESFSAEIMNPYYQNHTCDPFGFKDERCELGNYVSYAIDVTSAEDVVAGISFSQEHNVRLVIKNTGHDFQGKSTGKGGLSLWTHNLKSKEIIPQYTGTSNYTGPAVKLGAGVTGGEAALEVGNAGYRIVTGDCPTTGVAGGYTQGGGHSMLNSVYGVAADNVLEWEVVTAKGEHLVATQTQNADLYWAISGGGGGTFGVTLSMTTKIHADDTIVSGAALGFTRSLSPSKESFAAAVQAWWRFLPAIVDTGAVPLFNIGPTGVNVSSVTAPNRTSEEVAILFEPYLAQLRDLDITYDFAPKQWNTYLEHYEEIQGPLPSGKYVASMLFNSRFIPRAIAEDSDRARNFTAALETALAESDPAAGFTFGCNAMNVRDLDHPDNGVAPWWRNAVAVCLTFSLYDWTLPQSEMLTRKAWLADRITPLIEAATYDSGAYLNEADPLVYPADKPEKWQHAFHGTHYPRLRQIKDTYDPDAVFYANTAVGAEDWTTDGEGRLCRKA